MVVATYVVVSTQFWAITMKTSSRLRPNHPQLPQNLPLRREPQRLLEPGNSTFLIQPHPSCPCDPRYPEYSQAGFPLDRGAGSTPSGPNLTSTSESLSHVLLRKKSMAIPSGSTSYPYCLVPSTDRCRKRGPRGRRLVVLHPRMFVPWT